MTERGAGDFTLGFAGPREEVEWQLDAPDLDAVERWLEALGGRAPGDLEIDPAPTWLIEDLYLDTDDGRLRRAGYALRVRRTRGEGAPSLEATLKSLGSGGAAPARREELTEPLPRETGAPARPVVTATLAHSRGPVGARVRALAGARALDEILRVDTERITRALRLEGAAVAEIAVDRSTLAAPGSPVRRLDRVEVELANGAGMGSARHFVDALSDGCSLRPARASKLDVGLAPAHADSAADTVGADGDRQRRRRARRPWPPTVRRRARMAEVASAVLREPLATLAAAEPVAREGSDPEGVHQMRVATRRLQAALSLYAPTLGRDAGAHRAELRWLRGELGAVRDLDTYLERVARDRAARAEAGDGAPELAPLTDLLRRRRDEARLRTLLPALAGERYLSLLAAIDSLAGGGGGAAGAEATRRASPALRPALRKHGRSFRKALRRARLDGGSEERHRARIRTKQLRYALECSGSIYGRRARKALDALRALQELLGAERDALLAAEALTSLAADPAAAALPRATLHAMNEGVARERERAQELLSGLPRAAARAGRRWRRLRRARLRERT